MKKNLKAKSSLKKKRRHGFLRRKLTRSGRAVLARRRKAGRKKIAL